MEELFSLQDNSILQLQDGSNLALQNIIFDIEYQYAYSSSIEFDTQINEKIKGIEQRYPKRIYPKRTFTLKFDKGPTSREQIEAFFMETKGNAIPFNWTWETFHGGDGNTYLCFFDDESLNQAMNIMGYSEFELKLVCIDRNVTAVTNPFDFDYKIKYDYSMKFKTLKEKTFTANNNTRSMWDMPNYAWKLEFEATKETYHALENFFKAKRGKFHAFDWVWEVDKGGDGQTYRVRFDTDTLDVNIKSWDNILGATYSIPLKQVFVPPITNNEFEREEIIPRKLLKVIVEGGNFYFLDNDTLEFFNYDGNDYLGVPLDIVLPSSNDNTEVNKATVTMSNINQQFSGIIANRSDVITDSFATITLVFLNLSTMQLIPNTDIILFSGRCNNVKLTNLACTMDIETTLGGYTNIIPKMKHRVNCEWRKFKDVRCGYTGIEKTCDRTLDTCKRYGNSNNFGGNPSIEKETVIKV